MALPTRQMRSSDGITGLHDLLLRTGNKDELSFEELAILLQRPVSRLIYRTASRLSPAEVEALTSEVYFKIWSKADSYKGKSKGGHHDQKDSIAWKWVKTIAVNSVRSYFRRLSRLEQEVSETDGNPASESNEEKRDPSSHFAIDRYPSPELEIEQQVINHEGWLEFWASLNEQERQVCQLRLKGVAKSEIAEYIGVSPARISQILKAVQGKARKASR